MENLNKLTEKLINYINSLENFATTQTPDFINQFIAYETWKVEMWMWFSVAFFIIMIITQIIVITGADLESEGGMGAFLTVGVIGTLSLFLMASSYSDIKKLEIAPKIYMIEKARNMLIKESK